VPQYTIDAPGGGGKVPVNPDYVESITDEEVVFRNFQGETYRYPLKTSAIAPVGDAIPSPGAPIVVF
jgi:lysine 2,3-aminomutase